MSRAPTQEQKAKEAAVLYTALADLTVLFLQATFAIATQSVALLSEAIRNGLMLIVEFYTYFILRAVHRDRLGKFRFGIGKLEQMCNLAIGASLVLSGFWIAQHVIQSLLFDQAAATPLGLATAAVISAINLVINALGWFAMISASRSDDSAIFKGQLRARTVKLFSSLVVQTTMTIAALAKDPPTLMRLTPAVVKASTLWLAPFSPITTFTGRSTAPQTRRIAARSGRPGA